MDVGGVGWGGGLVSIVMCKGLCVHVVNPRGVGEGRLAMDQQEVSREYSERRFWGKKKTLHRAIGDWWKAVLLYSKKVSGSTEVGLRAFLYRACMFSLFVYLNIHLKSQNMHV